MKTGFLDKKWLVSGALEIDNYGHGCSSRPVECRLTGSVLSVHGRLIIFTVLQQAIGLCSCGTAERCQRARYRCAGHVSQP